MHQYSHCFQLVCSRMVVEVAKINATVSTGQTVSLCRIGESGAERTADTDK